ncbi:MAG: bifunctional diguanylate cyclase/phosphodiesterase [Oscillospiraceae bacterium]|nr:bifunctional diguanylate cyclase/phosphodiesterase [Oscillospiraceae bacterium]
MELSMRLEECVLLQNQWFNDFCYESILRATNSVIFEYYPESGQEVVSDYVQELIAGDYNGRMLSAVMIEDGVIHPDDVSVSIEFRKKAKSGGSGEINLRLLTPNNEYHWFRMMLSQYSREGKTVVFGIFTDINDDMVKKRALNYHAEFDLVSGVYNKSAFLVKTTQKLMTESDKTHYILSLDIDRFKLINELYSMKDGDAVLRYFGSIISDLAQTGETYGHFGGDIFCMCLTRPEEEVIALIEELEKRINTYPIAFKFIISVGIARVDNYDGEAVDVLCDHAAMAQKIIKGSYINRWAFYDQSMTEALNREHEIITSMEKALVKEEYEMYLQPKFDLNEGKIIGAEALSRWNHSKFGLMMPGSYIPLFERNGFILRLDEYMWELACRLIRKWMDQGRSPVPISVNVSRVHLYDENLCDKLVNLVKRYEIPPHLLELEITESAYTDCPARLYEVIVTLQKVGFCFSMDDFGSGYSSLHALKDIPVNVIKIDLKFLQKGRLSDEIGRGILQGTIRMIQDINLPIVAEGVETAEQAELLRSTGCNCAQGYYYAKPMSIESFERLMWT